MARHQSAHGINVISTHDYVRVSLLPYLSGNKKPNGQPNTLNGQSSHKYNFCRDTSFVARNTCLSQKTRVCHDKTSVCRDKYFLATKMILVAAPANNTTQPTMDEEEGGGAGFS